ncbi:ATP-binding cassette domain-containing protein, partial [bacterium]|nr:ATP-binding cassette domain-containing protein [bacterium]
HQERQEETYIQKRYHDATESYKRLKLEVSHRMNKARQADRKRSKHALSARDSDARNKKNMARLSGKDATAGKLLNQIKTRAERAQKIRKDITVKKTFRLGIGLETSTSARDVLFRLPKGSIPLGGSRRLFYPDLVMLPDERIALTGSNGLGKSTLVRYIMGILNIPGERVLSIPQEIPAGESEKIILRARNLPEDRLGQVMTVVSRLGSRPGRLLESTEPSPGELRKLLLGMGIADAPELIIMDEPTNHMDIPSILCIEEALDSCRCGLLLVSHDRRFLGRLTRTCWHISMIPGGAEVRITDL